MRKFIVFILILLCIAIPVQAENYLVHDDSHLMQSHDVENLEQIYMEFSRRNGFTPVVATVDSFGGLTAEQFASSLYDVGGYSQDGILLLVSLKEGQWYILTNGECHDRIDDWDAAQLGEELLPMIRDKQYYAAFLAFPEKALEIYLANAPMETEPVYEEIPMVEEESSGFGKTFAICMVVGLVIGGITVLVMALQMRSVRSQNAAADYVVAGSTRLTNSRDIYLYSHTTRTAKPKNTSGGSSGSRGGGSRGGAGGRI